MTITSALFRMARISADARAVRRSVDEGSPAPLLRRLANKLLGRFLIGKVWFR